MKKAGVIIAPMIVMASLGAAGSFITAIILCAAADRLDRN
jgi:hypothetical protein